MFAIPDNLLFFHMHHLSRDEGEAAWPWFPGSSFLPFLKTGVVLAFLQSSGAFPALYDLSKMMESGLTLTSAKSLSTHGWIPPGLMNLWVSSLPNPIFNQGKAPRAWDSWGPALAVSIKQRCSELCFLCTFCHQGTYFIGQPTFAQVFLLLLISLKKPLLSLLSFARFNSKWTLAFPDTQLPYSDSIPVFFLSSLTLFPHSISFLILSDFCQKCPAHPFRSPAPPFA